MTSLYLFHTFYLIKKGENGGLMFAAELLQSLLYFVIVGTGNSDVGWLHKGQAMKDVLDCEKWVDRTVSYGQWDHSCNEKIANTDEITAPLHQME